MALDIKGLTIAIGHTEMTANSAHSLRIVFPTLSKSEQVSINK